jgi:PGF-CTERM protein
MRKLHARNRVVSVAVVLAVAAVAVVGAASAGVPVAGAGGTPPASAAAGAAGPASDVSAPTFGSSAKSDQRGDVVRIAVRMPEGESAEVRILGIDTDYEATVRVTDDDFDGLVVVQFNTYVSGEARAFQTASDRDSLRVVETPNRDGPLAVGDYRLLTDGGDERADLTIEPRQTRAVDTMVAPVDASDRLRSVDAVARYREAGNLTVRSPEATAAVATRDTLVLRLRASGLSGVLADQPGDTVTERFRALVATDLVSLSLEQTNPGASQEAARLLLNRSGVHVVERSTTDTYFVVVDTAAAHYQRGDGEVRTGLPVGAQFRANLTVGPHGEFADERQTVTTDLAVVERRATVGTHSEAGDYYLLPERGQVVAGETTLAPGSTATVHFRTPDGEFERTRTVTVTAAAGGQGRFETAVGLQALTEGDTLEVSVAEDGTSLTAGPTTVTVRSPVATLDSATLTVDGTTLEVTLTANLSRGGLLTVRADNESGRILGVTTVDRGGERASVPLSNLPPEDTPLVVTAVRDIDSDGEYAPDVDVPYEQTTSTRPVRLTIVLYRLPPTATPTPSSTATPATPTADGTPGNDGTPTGTGTETLHDPTETTPPDTGDGPVTTPGFGALAALAALAAALLVLRRDRSDGQRR